MCLVCSVVDVTISHFYGMGGHPTDSRPCPMYGSLPKSAVGAGVSNRPELLGKVAVTQQGDVQVAMQLSFKIFGSISYIQWFSIVSSGSHRWSIQCAQKLKGTGWCSKYDLELNWIQSLQIKGKENKPLVEPELNHIYLHKLRGYPLWPVKITGFTQDRQVSYRSQFTCIWMIPSMPQSNELLSGDRSCFT